jgi:peptidyl-tRNA hydrolase, PTH1 family
MKIIVGLGNPGEKYENTPHNIGFETIDEFARKNNFPDFRLSKKFNALISEGEINDEKIILAKPQTFMNESGKAIKSIINKTGTFPAIAIAGNVPEKINLIIIHDDIDLPIGKIKVSQDRGSAGHKGVESIINAMGTKNFSRIRIGIQPQTGKPESVERFVLKKFSESEEKIFGESIKQAISAVENIISL